MEVEINERDFLNRFGNRLRELRLHQNLSYRKLSQQCSIDHSDISKIEKGERNIQLTTILELAKGLSVHPKEMFNFDL